MCFKKFSIKTAYADGLRRCPCCGVQLVWKSHSPNPQKNLATVDHIIPASLGGSDVSSNMFVMCRACNNARGNTCFVAFVTSFGFSRSKAETLYRDAFTATFQNMIYIQFTSILDSSSLESRKHTLKIAKKRRCTIRVLVHKYVEYFGDYLPEFKLLEKIIQN